MSRYLDKFVSTMPNSQAKHVLDFLTELRDDGTIRTVEEYNTRLRDLTARLEREEPAPLFRQFWAIVGDIIDSGRFNAMMKATRMDLETAFAEAENIGDVLELHKTLFKLTVLKALRKAVKELNKKITLYEFFNRDQEGFSDGQFNTFDDLGAATGRSDSLASQLFYDPRRRLSIDDSEDAVIDFQAERLVMPPASSEDILPIDISLVEDAYNDARQASRAV